ncbi:MAG: M23 family metallopeptidase [Solirubrobacterales bacterium]|nr:M23 family metallopeptidase [Solirubrobacterales bacterium]
MTLRSARLALSFLVTFAALVAVTAPASAVRPDSQAVLSPVAFQILNRPAPVRGADNRQHLVYEIQAVNQSNLSIELRKVAPRAQGQRLGAPLTGSKLAARTRLNSGEAGTTLGAGQSAIVFVDAAYSPRRRPPRAISHAISMAWPDAENPSEMVRQTFIGVSSRVSRRHAVVLSSPLRGPGWVAANGCCTLNAHRGATLAIDGTIRVPERFAIDFVQLNNQDRLFDGPLNDLTGYAYYGAPIRAAAPGRVVGIRKNLPEQVPGALPAGATIQMAGGNYVVVNIGHGRYAFYAHLKTGSLRVRKGQRVRTGQVLGLLGNTGNTDGPHLHFHIMDSPSPLQSNGLPFVFRSFRGQGVVRNVAGIQAGEVADVDRAALRGRHLNALPMENQIVRFGR